MKKLWLALWVCAALLPRAAALSAAAAVTMDADTGETLFAENADSRLPMASTTKIMTALVALGEGDLDRVYTVKKQYAAVEGSSMYLEEGERLTLRDTLYGLLLSSGNDAAAAVAGECGGERAFVDKMNAKARELGLTDTRFENPSGLPSDGHYTTARELAKITAAALRDPVFRDIVSTKTCTAAGRTLVNHNRLLSLYEDAIGVKTGFTRAAGRCLVSAAERNGRTVIAVTLNDPDDWNDHIALLDDAFSRYSEVTLHEKGDTLAQTQVFGGETDRAELVAESTVTAYLLPGEQDRLRRVRYGEKFCYAPVVRAAAAGTVEYRLGDAVIAADIKENINGRETSEITGAGRSLLAPRGGALDYGRQSDRERPHGVGRRQGGSAPRQDHGGRPSARRKRGKALPHAVQAARLCHHAQG